MRTFDALGRIAEVVMVTHKVLKEFNVTEKEVFDALEHGFRARADVKGKLAELKFSKHLKKQQASRSIKSYEWIDKDNVPDFLVSPLHGPEFWVEVKNVRSPKGRATPKGNNVPMFCVAEVWKSRNGKDANGNPTRKYKETRFQVLAVCTHNQDPRRRWKFRYIHAGHLTRDAHGYIDQYQTVDVYGAGCHWHDDLLEAYRDPPAAEKLGANRACA